MTIDCLLMKSTDSTNYLIELVLHGDEVSRVIGSICCDVDRPTKSGYSHDTPKDPKRQAAARKAAVTGRSSRKASLRRFNTSAKGRRFHRKLGTLNSRD